MQSSSSKTRKDLQVSVMLVDSYYLMRRHSETIVSAGDGETRAGFCIRQSCVVSNRDVGVSVWGF